MLHPGDLIVLRAGYGLYDKQLNNDNIFKIRHWSAHQPAIVVAMLDEFMLVITNDGKLAYMTHQSGDVHVKVA